MSRVGGVQAGQHAKERRLPRAVRPDDGRPARLHREGDLLERVRAAQPDADLAGDQRDHAARRLRKSDEVATAQQRGEHAHRDLPAARSARPPREDVSHQEQGASGGRARDEGEAVGRRREAADQVRRGEPHEGDQAGLRHREPRRERERRHERDADPVQRQAEARGAVGAQRQRVERARETPAGRQRQREADGEHEQLFQPR